MISPFAVEDIVIPVRNIANKMGVFVVDLHGETIISKAIIRKGAILCLESFT